jgi:hypothetical protein
MMERHINDRDHRAYAALRDRFGSERGAALLLVIVLSTIALVIMTTVLYMITLSTQLSGAEKRYRTAHEAAMGGIQIIVGAIQNQAPITVPGVSIVWNTSYSTKITNGNTSGFDASRDINPNDPATYDFYVDLGSPAYRVFAKICEIKKGNTKKGYKPVTLKTGVVPPAGAAMGAITPTFYSFSILAQKATNPSERTRMDLVHIY